MAGIGRAARGQAAPRRRALHAVPHREGAPGPGLPRLRDRDHPGASGGDLRLRRAPSDDRVPDITPGELATRIAGAATRSPCSTSANPTNGRSPGSRARGWFRCPAWERNSRGSTRRPRWSCTAGAGCGARRRAGSSGPPASRACSPSRAGSSATATTWTRRCPGTDPMSSGRPEGRQGSRRDGPGDERLARQELGVEDLRGVAAAVVAEEGDDAQPLPRVLLGDLVGRAHVERRRGAHHQRVLAGQVVEHLDHLLVRQAHRLVDRARRKFSVMPHDADALGDRAAARPPASPRARSSRGPSPSGSTSTTRSFGFFSLRYAATPGERAAGARPRSPARPPSRRTAPRSPGRWSRSGSRRWRCSRTGWPRTSPRFSASIRAWWKKWPALANGTTGTLRTSTPMASSSSYFSRAWLSGIVTTTR